MKYTEKILKKQLEELQMMQKMMANFIKDTKEKKEISDSVDILVKFIKSHIQKDFIKAYYLIPDMEKALKAINDKTCEDIFLEQKEIIIKKYKDITKN